VFEDIVLKIVYGSRREDLVWIKIEFMEIGREGADWIYPAEGRVQSEHGF
jgi:hypothetical protein